MEMSSTTVMKLSRLLESSSRPIYAVDSERRVAFCNRALADWLGLDPARIVGRLVEYHSEPTNDSDAGHPSTGVLADLCPPPAALAGVPCGGTIGCVARGGRLVHRRAEFIPLPANDVAIAGRAAIALLVILATSDMSADELAAELSDEPTTDELHRAIRRFRRSQIAKYSIESLLGECPGMRKVRAQIAAAAASRANVLVRGPQGSGRAHVARAIHYQAPVEVAGALVTLDCAVVSEDLLRRTLDAFRNAADTERRATLLVLNLEQLSTALQSQLLPIAKSSSPAMRIVATAIAVSERHLAGDVESVSSAPVIQPSLQHAVSTISIDVPALDDRAEDLPLLAQSFLEQCNRGSARQVGSIRPDALDLLAIYRWPGELDELRGVIASAHSACTTHEVTPAELPVVVHHAAKAAALPRRTAEKVVLDEFLAEIEREVIQRAMERAGGNKSAAADLLGITRPRLYRRLVQLGLIGETPEEESA